MIGNHRSSTHLRKHAIQQLDKLASARKPRLKFVRAKAASILMFKRAKASDGQTKTSQAPKTQSPKLRQCEQSMRRELKDIEKQQTRSHQMTELNKFIRKERNLIAKDAKLNSNEKRWLSDNLLQLSKTNRTTNRDAALGQHKKALNALSKDSKPSPRLKLHLKLIANYIEPSASTPHPTKKQAQSNINRLAEQSGRQHVQKTAHLTSSQPSSTHNSAHHSNNSSRLNPLTKQPPKNLDSSQKGSPLQQIEHIIYKGQEAGIVQEAIKTGFEAASLNNKSIAKKQLTDLHKPELSDVITLAKDRIDTKIVLGELSSEAGESAKTKIDKILSEFSNPYDRKKNMTSVMKQLRGDAADAKNALDAKNVLSKALNNTRVGKKDSSLGHVMMEARRITLDLPNSEEVKNILSNFGEQSGLYKQEADQILKQYADSVTTTDKGIENLSREELSYVFRMAKIHTAPGPHADKINAAIDQYALDNGLTTP